MSSRDDVNRVFYGDSSASPKRILSGVIPPPVAAAELYRAIDEVLGVEDEAVLARRRKRQRRKELRALKLLGLQKCYGLAPAGADEAGAPDGRTMESRGSGGVSAVKSLKNQFRKLWTTSIFAPADATEGTMRDSSAVAETIPEYPPIPVAPPVGFEVFVPPPALDTWTVLRTRSTAAQRRRTLLDRWYRRQQSEIKRRREAGASGDGDADSNGGSEAASEVDSGSESSDEDVLEGYETPDAVGDRGSETGDAEPDLPADADVHPDADVDADAESGAALGAENPFEFVEDYKLHVPLRASVEQASTMTIADVERLMDEREKAAAAKAAEDRDTAASAPTLTRTSSAASATAMGTGRTTGATSATAVTKKPVRRGRWVISTELKPLTRPSGPVEDLGVAAGVVEAAAEGEGSPAPSRGNPMQADRQRLLKSIFAPNAHKTQSYARWRYINQLTGSGQCMRAPSIAESDSFKNAKSVWEQLELEGYSAEEMPPHPPEELGAGAGSDSGTEAGATAIDTDCASPAMPFCVQEGDNSPPASTSSKPDPASEENPPSPQSKVRRRDRAKVAFKSMLASIKRAMPSSDNLAQTAELPTERTGSGEDDLAVDGDSAISRAVNMTLFGPRQLTDHRTVDELDRGGGSESTGLPNEAILSTTPHPLFSVDADISEPCEDPVQPLSPVPVMVFGGSILRRLDTYDISQAVEL
jgi:hypothetical protein